MVIPYAMGYLPWFLASTDNKKPPKGGHCITGYSAILSSRFILYDMQAYKIITTIMVAIVRLYPHIVDTIANMKIMRWP